MLFRSGTTYLTESEIVQDITLTYQTSINIGPLWGAATISTLGSACTTDHGVSTYFTHLNVGDKVEITGLSNTYYITAIANDIGYDKIFSKQMEYLMLEKAIAVAISSSGNSLNILRGLERARSYGWTTIALVGFNGGKVIENKMADIIIHVKANNYGVVEDCHMAILHDLAQKLRIDCSEDPTSLKL